MMAAQGLDMMFTVCFVVLVFFNVVVYGTKSGAYLVYFRSIISRISFNFVEKSFWYVIVTCKGVCALPIQLLENIAVCHCVAFCVRGPATVSGIITACVWAFSFYEHKICRDKEHF